MKITTKIVIILGLVLIEYFVMLRYFGNQDLDPSISIAIIVIIPTVFFTNILLAILCYFLKKHSWISIFLLNSIFASIIAYHTFGNEMDKQQNMRLESWEFKINDTLFRITRWKKSDDFSMEYSTNPGSSTGLMDGKYTMKKNELILISDSSRMKIKKNILTGFRNSDSIYMIKIER